MFQLCSGRFLTIRGQQVTKDDDFSWLAALLSATPQSSTNPLSGAAHDLFGTPPTNALNTLAGGGFRAAASDLLGFGLPSPPTNSLSTIASGALSATSEKPRSRSEWEARFAHWRRPASRTEEEKLNAALGRVTKALRSSALLGSHEWEAIGQGSYHNNTNVRLNSDVDVCVCLKDTFFWDGPRDDCPTFIEIGAGPPAITYAAFRDTVIASLQEEFGRTAVDTSGSKALHVHKEDAERISIDIVPAFTYRLYGPRVSIGGRASPQVGIAFPSRNGLVTNFPKQHYTNGCNKNVATARRFKRVARILKNLRDHLAENPFAPAQARKCAESTPSFLVESLVYNCPPPVFAASSMYDYVVAALRFLHAALHDTSPGTSLANLPPWVWWFEVNGIKRLFAGGQAWTPHSAAAFIDCAMSYMEL
jgi:hypothetical protein